MWQWRDTSAARERFSQSPFVARLFPEAMVRDAQRQFENQRMINDLIFPGLTPVRQTPVLAQVLERTPLRFPVWLLVGSDPDAQRALDNQHTIERAQLKHVLAARLANRDFPAALTVARALEEHELLPGLLAYLEQAARAPPPEPQAPEPAAP
jgi:hypothetical protein